MFLFSFVTSLYAHKLDFRSLFLGYSHLHKEYKCLASGGRIFISKDILFDELQFPYSKLFPKSPNSIKDVNQYFLLQPNLSPPGSLAPFVSSIVEPPVQVSHDSSSSSTLSTLSPGLRPNLLPLVLHLLFDILV